MGKQLRKTISKNIIKFIKNKKQTTNKKQKTKNKKQKLLEVKTNKHLIDLINFLFY